MSKDKQPKPTSYESLPKRARVKFQISEHVFKAIQTRAKRQGISYQRFMRQALEQEISRDW